jgi:predicted permease
MMILASVQVVHNGIDNNKHHKWRLLVIVLVTSTAAIFFLLVSVMRYLRKRKLKAQGKFSLLPFVL